MWLLGGGYGLGNLKQLRVNLTRQNFSDQHRKKGDLHVNIGPGTPHLEVVELDIHHNLAIFLDLSRELTLLVVIAAGTLQVHVPDGGWGPRIVNTTKQLDLQSGAALSPRYKSGLKVYHRKHPEAPLRLLDYIKEEQNGWTAQEPSSFYPGSLQRCCCKACPECLAHAGVPVICDEAWTRNGFSKHLRQCSI